MLETAAFRVKEHDAIVASFSNSRICQFVILSTCSYWVACLNIANVLVVWGTLCLGSSVLHLYASIAAAAQAAKRVGADGVAPDEGLDLNSQQPAVFSSQIQNSNFFFRHLHGDLNLDEIKNALHSLPVNRETNLMNLIRPQLDAKLLQ